MDIETILSKEDIEKPRTIVELGKWVKSIHAQFASSKEGKNYARQRKGLSKEYFQEIYPLLRFAEAKYGQTNDVVLKPIIGSQKHDAIVQEIKTKVTYQVEITFAVDGYEELHKMYMLEKDGVVSVYADLDIKGSKNKGYSYKVNHRNDRADIFNKYIDYVEEATKKKILKTYVNVPVLIVGVDDFMVLWDEEDTQEFKKQIQDKIGHLEYDFKQIWVVGMSGKYSQLINKTNKTVKHAQKTRLDKPNRGLPLT